MGFLTQILGLLSAPQKRRYGWISAYFLFAAVVQVVGVASVAPFIALVSNPQLIHSNVVAEWAFTTFGAGDDKTFLMAFAVGLMLLIVLTNAVMATATWLIASFSIRVGIEMQEDIFRGLLHRQYASLARTNSSELIGLITNDTNRFVYMVLQPLLMLVSQAFIVLLVTVGLLVFNPLVALSAGVIVGGGYFAVFGYLKTQLVRNGETAWRANNRKLRILQESLGGIKEIKLAGNEQYYERELDSVNAEGLRANIRIGLYGDLPRFVLESVAFCALLGLGIYLLSAFDKPQDIVGVLSLYAMAGYKLLPAAQSIFKSASQIRANLNVTDNLQPAIDAGRAVIGAPLDKADTGDVPDGDIRFDDVTFRYPGTERDVISGLTCEIPARAITVLVGSSGAGKSTAADLLLGLLQPTHGHITAGGVPISRNVRGWQRRLGYVAQSIFLLDDSIVKNITFGTAHPMDPAKLRRAADQSHVSEFALALPEGFDSRVGERGGLLSGGQRQRIGIARALYREADILIMDEATSALDAVTENGIIATLAELKREKTVVMIAHRLSTIQAADHILMFHQGKLVASGSYDELMAESVVFSRLAAGVNDEQGASDDVLQPV